MMQNGRAAGFRCDRGVSAGTLGEPLVGHFDVSAGTLSDPLVGHSGIPAGVLADLPDGYSDVPAETSATNIGLAKQYSALR
jgi:hypothetical protein